MNAVGIDIETKNSRRKYPFVDYADMRYAHAADADNAGIIPTEFIVGAQFICPDVAFADVRLLYFSVSRVDATSTVTLTFRIRPVPGLAPVYERDDTTIDVVASVVSGVAPTGWVASAAGGVVGSTAKLLFGTGLVDVAEWDTGQYNAIGVPRIIPSLALHYNTGLQRIVVDGREYSGDIRFKPGPGAEVGIDPVGGSVTINGGPEYGLPGDCGGGNPECPSDVLLSINGVTAAKDTGNITLIGVGGATVEADYDAMELVLKLPPPDNCSKAGA